MASAATLQSSSSQPTTFEPLQSTFTTQSSSTNTPKKARDVTTTLNYFVAPADGSAPPPNIAGDAASYNRPVDPHVVTIHDIRGHEEEFTLEKTGFQVVKSKSPEKEFLDDEQIKAVYYPDVEDVLKKTTGANRVFIFDHTIRREATDTRAKSATNTTTTSSEPSAAPVTLRGPVQRVHIDQSAAAAPQRVQYHLPSDASTLLNHRYAIINLWRPIKTIFKSPLAIASSDSVSDADLVGVKLIYPNREGETYGVKYGEGQKWYYANELSPEEAILISCFDSETGKRVPHSAFRDEEREGEEFEARESIEVRALVFWE